MKNLFSDIPDELPNEITDAMHESDSLRIERIVSYGHSTPQDTWYDQDRHEWVVLLQGAATLRFEDRTVELKRGDYLNIPAHRRHRVERTQPNEPTIWLAVYYG